MTYVKLIGQYDERDVRGTRVSRGPTNGSPVRPWGLVIDYLPYEGCRIYGKKKSTTGLEVKPLGEERGTGEVNVMRRDGERTKEKKNGVVRRRWKSSRDNIAVRKGHRTGSHALSRGLAH